MREESHRPTIGFAGLSHLGLVSAVCSAARGFAVVGWDPDAELVADVAAGRLPVSEPDLDNLAHRHAASLSWTADIRDIGQCDLVYVALDVPTNDDDESDLEPVSRLIERLLPALQPDALLVILCQVPPGFTRRIPLAKDRLFYQVETLIFGRAVVRALEPERFIIGCADPEASLPPPLRAALAPYDCPILPMAFESAELTKISINLFLAAQLTVTNSLAELSEKIGADWSQIAPALRLDRRIGPHAYLQPGLGIGGGNILRDMVTARHLADEAGSDSGWLRAAGTASVRRRHWPLPILHRTLRAAGPDGVLAVLGLAYKEETRSIKNSPGVALVRAMGKRPIRAYDPEVAADAVVQPNLVRCKTALEAVDGAAAVVIMTPWAEFRDLDPSAFADRIVIDPYGMLDRPRASAAGVKLATLGRPFQES